MKFIMELFTLLSYCIPFVTIPVFAVSAILMIRTFFAEQAPEQSKKRKRYLGYMLVSFLFFLPYFWGEFTSHFTVSLSSQYLHL